MRCAGRPPRGAILWKFGAGVGASIPKREIRSLIGLRRRVLGSFGSRIWGAPYQRMAPAARKLSIDGYLAFYRIADDAIHVMRVVDQRRLLEAIKLDEQ